MPNNIDKTEYLKTSQISKFIQNIKNLFWLWQFS